MKKYALKKVKERRPEVGELNRAYWVEKHKEKFQHPAEAIQRPINILVMHLNLQQTTRDDSQCCSLKRLCEFQTSTCSTNYRTHFMLRIKTIPHDQR